MPKAVRLGEIMDAQDRQQLNRQLIPVLMVAYRKLYYDKLVKEDPPPELRSYWIHRLGEDASVSDLNHFETNPEALKDFLENPKKAISFSCPLCEETTVASIISLGRWVQCLWCKQNIVAPDPRIGDPEARDAAMTEAIRAITRTDAKKDENANGTM